MRPVARILLGLATLALLPGCGNGGVVPVQGKVLVEGKPVEEGRLILTPIGGGPKVFAAVAPDGSFSLRSADNPAGAYPGSYLVMFRCELDAQAKAKIRRLVPGQLTVDELSATYKGPEDTPLVISETGQQDLMIDIRGEHGWKQLVSD